MASTALDIIQGAFLNINAYNPNETLSSADAAIGLNLLNDLVDSLSQDEGLIYTQSETTFQWQAGKYQYSVGNYAAGTFTGTLSSGSPTITGVTVPSNIQIGGTITDNQGLIPAGTTVLSTGVGTVTMSANATNN